MIDPDRSTVCCALSSPVVNRLRCTLDVTHVGAHEATLRSGALYQWFDDHDTVRHWDSPCVLCHAPLRDHAVKGDACPQGGGWFHPSAGGA